jgi:hypothetical protein
MPTTPLDPLGPTPPPGPTMPLEPATPLDPAILLGPTTPSGPVTPSGPATLLGPATPPEMAMPPGPASPPDALASLPPLVSLDQLFSLAGALAMVGWLALVLFPRSALVTDRLVGIGVPAALGVVYAGLILAFWAGSPGGYGSLDAVAALFSSRGLLLAGWVHYLALDLFVGAWAVRTARADGIPHLLVVPCLAMTLLFGPVGLSMFLGLRLARRVAVPGAVRA